MNEKEIFQVVVEYSDPAERQEYLARACGGDDALRARIEALLDAHTSASSDFLDVPAVEQMLPKFRNHKGAFTLPSSGHGSSTQCDEDEEAGGPAYLGFLRQPTKPGSLGRLGHYEILQILGQGAFGIVFEAFDDKLHRHVAVKVMCPQLASTSPPRKRFLREARSVAAIKHENIIQIYSVEEEPLPYLAMELVNGKTLQQKLNDCGPLDVPEILNLGRQMASGLAAAHSKGLIHRDIKPGNILLEVGAGEVKVKITDFGLARAVDDATMTRSGTIAGTPMYMAPEQAMGQTLDHRADLFSLGSVLYQMTCGRPPFRGANAMAVLKRVTEEQPRPIQDILPLVPDWLCAIIEKLHAKNPNERYQSAEEVADALVLCQTDLQTSGKVMSVPVRHHADVVIEQPVGPSNSTPPTNQSGRESTFGRQMMAVVVALISLVSGLGVMELTGITHLLSSARREAVPVATSVTQSERVGVEVQPTKAGASAETPSNAISPFNSNDASAHQEAWATYLEVPVEFTNSIGMKLRLIPPGEFTMGMTHEEAVTIAALPIDEYWKAMSQSSAPEHRVRLSQAYYMGKYEVSQAQYEKVMGVNPSYFSAGGEGRDMVRGEDTKQHPVENISFIDAAEFCITLSKLENLKPVYFSSGGAITLIPGNGYRLPTEAEWEYACRAGTTTAWFHGEQENALGSVAWWGTNSGGMTHPVGQLKANPFGLYDVHGNVWEWCQDWYDPNVYAQRGGGPTVDPHVSSGGMTRVLRGGTWCDGSSLLCRSALRHTHDATSRYHHEGFRLCAGVCVASSAPKLPTTLPTDM